MARSRERVFLLNVKACEDADYSGYLLGLARIDGLDDSIGYSRMEHPDDECAFIAHVVSVLDASSRFIISVEPGDRLSYVFVGHALPSFLRIVLTLC